MDQDAPHKDPDPPTPGPPSIGMKRSASDGTASGDGKRQRGPTQVADPNWALDKQHADAVINFLIRLACQVYGSIRTLYAYEVGTWSSVLIREVSLI